MAVHEENGAHLQPDLVRHITETILRHTLTESTHLTAAPPLRLLCQFSEVADKFCQKYNSKHGSTLSLDSSLVELKVGRSDCPAHIPT